MLRKVSVQLLALVLSLIGLIIIIYFSFEKHFNDGSFNININTASAYGNFIGGLVGPIFSFASILLIYQTIVDYRKLFQIQQFEVGFFEMLRHQNDVLINLKHLSPSNKNKIEKKGIKVFIEMISQLEKSNKLAKEYLKESNFSNEHIEYISFFIFYNGVSLVNKDISEIEMRKAIKDEDIIKGIIENYRNEKTRYNQELVYFGGHRSRLEPYIKNIEDIIFFIESKTFLSDEKKEIYINMIKSRITYHELYILKQYEKAVMFRNKILNNVISDKKICFSRFINNIESTNIFDN